MKRLFLAGAVLCGLGASAQAAGFDCSKWEKTGDGWSAKEPVEIGGQAGRIDYTPGEIYKEGQQKNGLDIAKLLNANCDKSKESGK